MRDVFKSRIPIVLHPQSSWQQTFNSSPLSHPSQQLGIFWKSTTYSIFWAAMKKSFTIWRYRRWLFFCRISFKRKENWVHVCEILNERHISRACNSQIKGLMKQKCFKSAFGNWKRGNLPDFMQGGSFNGRAPQIRPCLMCSAITFNDFIDLTLISHWLGIDLTRSCIPVSLRAPV